MDKKPFLSIGIMAHNEEKNIGFLIDEFLKQSAGIELTLNITVIGDGCTDKTEDVVRGYENKNNSVKLLIQKERKGKASAINLFLSQKNGDLLIISSADIILAENTLKRLLHAFSDFAIGMVGGRPIPKFSIGMTGLFNRLLWDLHHEVALFQPKLGELIAIRNIIDRIPEETAADEAAIEALIMQKGFKIKYLPNVIIYNYCPKSLISFIKKRTRIFIGHLYVKNKMNYKVSTYNIVPLVTAVIKKIKKEKEKSIFIIMLICLEIYARTIALYEYYVRNKLYFIWEK